MQAPGQSELDYVVNDEFDLSPTPFAPPGVPSPFDIPPEAPPCIPVGAPRTHSEAISLISAAGFNPLVLAAFPEVRLARTLHLRSSAK